MSERMPPADVFVTSASLWPPAKIGRADGPALGRSDFLHQIGIRNSHQAWPDSSIRKHAVMNRLKLALRVLFDGSFAAAVQTLGTTEETQKAPARIAAPVAPPKPARSEAIALLETLQREARLVDFIKEPIDTYTDTQIGAAVREIHRDCGTVFERLFAIRPILLETEGSQVEIAADCDAGRIRLTGNVTGERPPRGKLMHHGWEAQHCELPEWTGSDGAANVLAPAEVEV